MPIEVTSIEKKRRRLQRVKKINRIVKESAQLAAARKRRIIVYSILASFGLFIGAILFLFIHSYQSYAKIVDERLAHGYLTSRAGVYAAPRVLRAGQTLSRDQLVMLLSRAGYVESGASDVWSGSFTALEENGIEIRPRHTTSAEAVNAPEFVRIIFDRKNRIAAIRSDAGTLESYQLEPEILTTDASMKSGKRRTLAYRDIPPVLVQAILSIEDRRFFEHRGVDLFGIARALLRNAGDQEIGQGGSTITQQLVKNTYLSPERTFRRKYAEAMLAFTLERRLSKEDIFALYCNEVYLGQRGTIGVRGVEQASRVYFSKELKDLSLSEAAMIAGMIQSPNRYSLERHTEAAIARRNTVLDAMVRDGAITSEQAQAAARETLVVAPIIKMDNSLAPYFVDYVNRVIESKLESSTATEDERSLRVYTTIDLELQQIAEAALKRQLERLDKIYSKRKLTPQAALVALDPKTGHVLAMVGGRDYATSQLNRATDALRQPGSVYKPFVYAAAMESGISPTSMHMDAPQEFLYDRKSIYRPANYGGGYSMQPVMMRTGLVKSLNVVTVDVAMTTGLKRIANFAESFGLPKPEPYPALALGTTEATPLQLAAAYTAFAHGGQRVEPIVVTRAADADGVEIINATTQTKQIIKPSTAYLITDMLGDVIDHGTARGARGAVKRTAVAGKTGTSRDGWFVGYTPNLICAVWIGFDDNKQLGLTGAEAALPAWTEFVKNAVELRPDLGGEAFERPAGVIYIDVDPETGMLAGPFCPQHERIAITGALAPHAECYTHSSLDLYASADEMEYYDPALNESNDNRLSENTSNRRSLPSAQARNTTVDTQINPTRVEKNARGRSTLVTDMSSSGRSP